MYTLKNRAFLVKNHLKSFLGAVRYQNLIVRGRQWHWIEAGSTHAPETVVLLHGMATSKNYWRTVIPRLARDFHIIVPDVPGFKIGLQAANPDQGFEGLAIELGGFLNALVGRPMHLIGHSMAATLATGLALRMSVPVHSLTLVSLAESIFSDDLAKALRAEKVSDYIRNYSEQSHLEYVRSMFFCPPPALNFIAKSSWRHIRNHKHDIVRLCEAMENELNFLEYYAWSQSLPTLIVNGQLDLWRDKTRESYFFNGSSVRRLELSACRHLPFIEQPIEFIEAVSAFLLEHSRATS